MSQSFLRKIFCLIAEICIGQVMVEQIYSCNQSSVLCRCEQVYREAVSAQTGQTDFSQIVSPQLSVYPLSD
jgi:hypothetical protein